MTVVYGSFQNCTVEISLPQIREAFISIFAVLLVCYVFPRKLKESSLFLLISARVAILAFYGSLKDDKIVSKSQNLRVFIEALDDAMQTINSEIR